MMRMPLGPIMLDVEGKQLENEDRRRLQHPQTGGVILFSRNFESVDQIRQLCSEIKALRDPELLIAVDHEGGRVQRFRAGFTPIPAMRTLGRLWETDPNGAMSSAEQVGYLIASELASCQIDFSFTPVLDLDFGRSAVIGNRAFHRDPEAVSALGGALIAGLRAGGVASVGKHFPGHGYVEADSHVDVPEDPRSLAQIESADLLPFARLVRAELAAVMPAHVIYPAVDRLPAGFSSIWLKDILRTRLGFEGMIFSDDLTMEGARMIGDIRARANAAFAAGCNMVLVCNKPDASNALLSALERRPSASTSSLASLLSAMKASRAERTPAQDPRYSIARERVLALAADDHSATA